jgi:probable F420-dependent oxidoreductase
LAHLPSTPQSLSTWRDEIRRIEDIGFSTVAVADHFTQGSTIEPVVAMCAAACVTERLRVLCMVFGNDYRHPVLVHRSMALLDVLSEGRVEVGLGAGWMRTDYEAAGIPSDPPGVRIDRLREAVTIVKGLFGDAPFSFSGEHYTITALDGLPKPTQKPHPPLMIGGGGRRVLSLAAEQADMVSVSVTSTGGEVRPEQIAREMSAEGIAEKIGWVRSAAEAAGRRFDDLEIQLGMVCTLTDSAEEARSALEAIAKTYSADPAQVEKSPAVLVGTLEQCVETLEERRERLGISYVSFLFSDPAAVAPLVARAAGR